MKREELQHDFHNEQGINWLNSQGEPDIDYVMWLENKILAIKNNTSLPPAEGAEEILANLEAYYDFKFHWIEKDRIIRAMHEFAALHALQMAEKMVEWVSVKDKLPEERENVLCYNGYRISSHNWCKHTDQDDDWFKKTFTHWCKLPKTP